MMVDSQQDEQPPSRIDPSQLAAFRRVSLTLGKQANAVSARQAVVPREDEEMKNYQEALACCEKAAK